MSTRDSLPLGEPTVGSTHPPAVASTPGARLRARAVGLAASLALVGFVAGVPLALVAIGAVPSTVNLGWGSLTAPDDGTVALAVLTIVCWVAWAVFTASIAVALVARLRGRRVPHIPGLAVPQVAARRLVAAAALLFVAVPAVSVTSMALPQPRAAAEPAADLASTAAPAPPHRAIRDTTAATAPSTPTAPTGPPPGSTPASAPARPTAAPPRTVTYVVKRGDSLWRIAAIHLGDPKRYLEIYELNKDILGDDPDFLIPGTVLRLPALPATVGALGADGEETYTVQPDQTLSEIAQDELGDAADYPEIAAASRHTRQPDGEHLTDPDLIRPGWRLTIPNSHASPAPSTTAPARPAPTTPAHRRHLDHPHAPTLRTPPSTAPATPVPQPQTTPDGAPTAGDQPATTAENATPGWLLPGLTGAGALLAGSLLVVVRQHRRTQLRYRRPGRIVAPPPPELREAEKSAQATGSVTAPRIEDLDRVLCTLAGTPAGLVTATLSDQSVQIHLTRACDLPAPWTGHGTAWSADLNHRIDSAGEQCDAVAPYPLLISVGRDDDGGLVLLNLEEARCVVITGDEEKAVALGRHMAAELSLNPWSTLVEIDTLGLCEELAAIDPLRLRQHPPGETAFLDHLADDLHSEDPSLEPDQFRAVLVTGQAAEVAGTLSATISGCPGRAGAAVVAIAGEATPDDLELHVAQDGRLTLTALGLDLTAAGLTAAEAEACAVLVDLTREPHDAPVPPAEDPAAISDAGGALRPELTEPRAEEPPGERSLLPRHAHDYEQAAATTAPDIERLAPAATHTAEQAVGERDPRLDDDLARWDAPVVLGPRLTLLGPVNARTAGDASDIAHRKPFYVELLAYLALHPHGVSAAQVADAFGTSTDRARTDLSNVRKWLGKDPHTAKPYLPNARAEQTHSEHGLALYRVHGVLCDLDLFRRLRTRGQSRGAEGIEDLITALHLVTGEPFSRLRAAGWTWLLDGDRIDHVMTCAVVDVAHIVTTHALTAGDLDLARFAAQTSYAAAPFDETARLDLIAVAAATGHAESAERQLIDGVLNRSDDHLGPTELPERSAGVIRQRGWKTSRATSKKTPGTT